MGLLLSGRRAPHRLEDANSSSRHSIVRRFLQRKPIKWSAGGLVLLIAGAFLFGNLKAAPATTLSSSSGDVSGDLSTNISSEQSVETVAPAEQKSTTSAGVEVQGPAQQSSNVEVQVNQEHISVPAGESVHRVIKHEDGGQTIVDVQTSQTGSGSSFSSSSVMSSSHGGSISIHSSH